MSSRRTRKRKLTEVTSEISQPKVWNKEKLIKELHLRGINVPVSFGHATLLKLFNENKDKPESNLNMTASTDNQDVILQPPNILSGTEKSASEMNCIRESGLTDLSASESRTVLQPTGFQSLADTNASLIKRMRQQGNVPSIADGERQTSPQTILQQPVSDCYRYFTTANSETGLDMQSALQNMRQPSVPSEQYRNVEIISPNLRNQILSGKDINLPLLLMPNNDSLAEYRRVDFNGTEYSMRPCDPRLTKNLSLGEFITAFSKYRNIIYEVMPHRREELDYYERDIVKMAQRFGGQRFYEYHKVFTAKAAALLQQRGIKVDWAVRDNGLFCTIFAGMRTNVCTLCSSVNHTSDFCSLVVNPYWKRATQQISGSFQRSSGPGTTAG